MQTVTRISDEDQRGERRKIRLYPSEWAAITKLAGDAPPVQWIRDAALERMAAELGIPVTDLDSARRPAPRRRNYARRNDTASGPADDSRLVPGPSLRLSRREWDTISGLAAGTSGGASGWVREAAREKLSKEKGQ